MLDMKNKDIKRVVVKVGTTTLTHETGRINLRLMEKLAWVLTDIRNQGKEVILVSSGAIAVGTDKLNLPNRPRDIKGKQAAASVGQCILMQIYENFFSVYNQRIGQILITKDVLSDPLLNENARNTFFTLFEMGVIPIVNENDTVSVEEFSFSDNDNLSAYVACLTDSDCLIILSDIEGLYDADPKIQPNAKLISEVLTIDEHIHKIAGTSSSSLGTGGMASKISAAQMATNAGIDTIIGSGSDPEILFKILSGEKIGTLFRAQNVE